MSTRVYMNGQVLLPEAAQVSIFDRGFLYGDSVYEVMRTAGGHPVDLERHLARLSRSAAALVLPVPEVAHLRDAIAAAAEAAGNPESYLRVVVTRGAGRISLDIATAGEPTVIVIAAPLELPPEELYREGAHVALVGVERTSRRAVDPAIKSGNYLNNVMALAEARRSGAYEAIMCGPSGRVAEGSTSNLFVVRGGRVTTPALATGLLPGITRQRVMELATEDGISIDEGDLGPDDVREADEVFLTSSIRGVLPVRQVDDRAIAAPGPVTARLMQLYAGFLDRVARGRLPDLL